jgi:hypothetical protein
MIEPLNGWHELFDRLEDTEEITAEALHRTIDLAPTLTMLVDLKWQIVNRLGATALRCEQAVRSSR